jgi:hypothetical protein
MIVERTSLGADPSDPTLCIWKERSDTSRSYFSRFSQGMAPEGLSALRQGMADLFAGTRSEFKAEYMGPSVSGNRFEYEATWRRLGAETIMIAGKSMATIVFEQTSRGIRGNTSHSVWKLWYAPEVGNWVKNETVSGGGRGRSFDGDWTVHKIIEP